MCYLQHMKCFDYLLCSKFRCQIIFITIKDHDTGSTILRTERNGYAQVQEASFIRELRN